MYYFMVSFSHEIGNLFEETLIWNTEKTVGTP